MLLTTFTTMFDVVINMLKYMRDSLLLIVIMHQMRILLRRSPFGVRAIDLVNSP